MAPLRHVQIAGIAHAAADSAPQHAIFQGASALLLFAAASSSCQVGPALLKALSRYPGSDGVGILPRALGAPSGPGWSPATPPAARKCRRRATPGTSCHMAFTSLAGHAV